MSRQAISFVVIAVLAFSAQVLPTTLAWAASAPVVSIGIVDGREPVNAGGPTDGAIVHGAVPVYATVSDVDGDLDNYHFRVIKDNDDLTVWGNNADCSNVSGLTPGAFFAPENQGYASTTLSKTACGFIFHQAVALTGVGFTNQLIATLNTADLAAAPGGGDGGYWLVLGALDQAGNRFESDYQNDPKVEIVVDNTAPVSTITSPTAGASSTTPIMITGTSNDAHGITSTTLTYASYDGTSCGTASPLATIAASSTWSYEWTPAASGSYCLTAYAQDVAGNVEAPGTTVSNINYQAPITPVVPPTPPADTTSSSGSTGGGSHGSGGGSMGFIFGNGGGFVPPASPTTPTSPKGTVLGASTDHSGNLSFGNVADSGASIAFADTASSSGASSTVATSTTTDNVSQLAAVGALGGSPWWSWLLGLGVIALAYYAYKTWA